MYLSANNLFERSEFERNANADEVKALLMELEKDVSEEDGAAIAKKIKSMCGFFNKTCRVRIIKLRGQYSQGFIAGVDSIVNYKPDLKDTDWDKLVGTQFNFIDEDEFCKKYIPLVKGHGTRVIDPEYQGQSIWRKRMKKLKRFNRLIDNQFAYHYDTKMLAEHIHELSPDDIVSVTVKVHGTSAIFSKILVNRQLSRWEKIKKFFGFKVDTVEYGNIYASRTTIKNQYINPKAGSYYNVDIWGCVNRDLSPYLDDGMTVYGEIVGYLEGSTSMIQKQHDYGCKPGQWKFMPYRITSTDELGNKTEWEIKDVDEWTHKLVENHPELAEKILFLNFVYYGRLGDMYPDIPIDDKWNDNLLKRMKNDKELILMELDEPMCTHHSVPREGIVLRIVGDKFSRAWKLKSLRHYGKEAEAHDKGEVDIEEAESSYDNEATPDEK